MESSHALCIYRSERARLEAREELRSKVSGWISEFRVNSDQASSLAFGSPDGGAEAKQFKISEQHCSESSSAFVSSPQSGLEGPEASPLSQLSLSLENSPTRKLVSRLRGKCKPTDRFFHG